MTTKPKLLKCIAYPALFVLANVNILSIRRACVTGYQIPLHVQSAKKFFFIMTLIFLKNTSPETVSNALLLQSRVALIDIFVVYHHLKTCAENKDNVCIEHNL